MLQKTQRLTRLEEAILAYNFPCILSHLSYVQERRLQLSTPPVRSLNLTIY
jgi:hypothetical protein